MKVVMLIEMFLTLLLYCGGCVRVSEHDRTILTQMDKISMLWDTDNVSAREGIEALRQKIDAKFFEKDENCRAYAEFFGKLKLASIPLEKRSYVGWKCFSSLLGIFNKNYRDVSNYQRDKHTVFLVPMYVSCALQMRAEYKAACALEKELMASLAENPNFQTRNRVRYFKVGRHEEFKRHTQNEHLKRTVEEYRTRLLSDIERYDAEWFDGHDAQLSFEEIPEPRRTQLIHYIESKIGRKMKWRK